MTSTLKFMTVIAKKAGKIQLKNLGLVHKIKYKSPIDIVTETDHACEKMIVTAIQKKYPDDDILAEEGSGKRHTSGRRWHIDPLDGTVNFAHGFPFFCVSIALEIDGEIKFGVIYDPNRNELFAAEKGKGATLNGKRIKVSATPKLKQSLVATGFACLAYNLGGGQDNINNFTAFIKNSRAVRRPGSAAIDLAWTAAGRIDGFWELGLKPWDMAAGTLLIREAGGKVTSFDQKKFDLYATEVLASNGLIHGEMSEILKSA